jgi:hypothetical protein
MVKSVSEKAKHKMVYTEYKCLFIYFYTVSFHKDLIQQQYDLNPTVY